jgi:hypothetical protein
MPQDTRRQLPIESFLAVGEGGIQWQPWQDQRDVVCLENFVCFCAQRTKTVLSCRFEMNASC